MFIGHFALAFGTKGSTPALSLGTLFLACQFADLLWPTLLLTGVESVRIDPGNTAFTPLDFEHYPYSHSLVLLIVWGGILGFIAAGISRVAGAVAAVGGLVVSHWFLDLIVHRPDLPMTPWSDERYGESLWNSVPTTLAIEGVMFTVGVAMYARSTRARDRAGSVALWTLVAFLVAVYLASAFGPPPPSEGAIAWAGHAIWLLVLWGYYVDRHREPRTTP